MKRAILGLVLAAMACNLTRNPVKPTPVPPTLTPDGTGTALAQEPAATTTIAASATATQTATITQTATPSASPTQTATPRPTSTPLATIAITQDNVVSVEIPTAIRSGLDRAWLAFTVTDQQTTPLEDGEAAPDPIETVYVIRPDTGNRVKVIDLPAATENRIYWSPTGLHMAYFLGSNDPSEAGLYLLSIQTGRVVRLYQGNNLQPRGISGHQPIWSPDGTRLAFVLPTEYETDIFIVNADGSGLSNLTNSPAYEFWPAWSPDGKNLGFVSDRDICPSWIPDTPNSCDRPDAMPPRVGKLYVYNFETARLSKVTENTLNAPPIWVNQSIVSVSEGSLDPFSEVSNLIVYDVGGGSTWQLTPADNALYGAPSWTEDAQRVIYQRIGQGGSSVVLADRFGTILNNTDAYVFVRFGMAADWSMDGAYVAVAGSNGQCPYGLVVLNSQFTAVSEPPQNLLACDPLYDPTGDYLAFTGIQVARGTDGRLDIYLAEIDGTNPRAITRNLEGIIRVLGWVGPTFSTAE